MMKIKKGASGFSGSFVQIDDIPSIHIVHNPFNNCQLCAVGYTEDMLRHLESIFGSYDKIIDHIIELFITSYKEINSKRLYLIDIADEYVHYFQDILKEACQISNYFSPGGDDRDRCLIVIDILKLKEIQNARAAKKKS